MRKRDYDFKTRRCKICGALIAPDSLDLHTDIDCLKWKILKDEMIKEATKKEEICAGQLFA